MKKKTVFALVLLLACTASFAQTYDLDKAISAASKEITTFFGKGEYKKKTSTLAVVVSMTDTQEMENYLITGFESAIAKSKNCQLVSRDSITLAARQAEINYQYSGYVSDNAMVQLGKEAGAQFIVSVTFSQVDDDRRLVVKTVDVQTSRIVVGTSSYRIADSRKVQELLQNTKKLTVLTDFLAEMQGWQTQKRDAESRRDQEILDTQGAIKNEYAQKIAEANQQAYPENYSDARVKQERSAKIQYLEEERDKKVSDAQKTVTEKYAAGIQTCEDKKEAVIEEMLRKEFSLRGQEQVFVTLGDFERNAVPQYFPVSFASQDQNVLYHGEFRLEVKQDDTSDYNRINEPKKAGAIIGQLIFKLERVRGTDEFNVRVRRLSLINARTNAVLWTAEPNAITNRVPVPHYDQSGYAEPGSYVEPGDAGVSYAEYAAAGSVADAQAQGEQPVQSDAQRRVGDIRGMAERFYYGENPDEAPGVTGRGFVVPAAQDALTVGGRTLAYTGESVVAGAASGGGALVFGRYEVTQELYKAVMDADPSRYTANDYWYEDWWSGWYLWYNGSRQEEPPKYLPVQNVTLYDAVVFCNKLTTLVIGAGQCVYYSDAEHSVPYSEDDAVNRRRVYADATRAGYRLPTADEWDKAAGVSQVTSWDGDVYTVFATKYSGSDTLGDVAWYADNSRYDDEPLPSEVGTKRPNRNGLYDMTGNVWEWTFSETGLWWDENAVPIKGGCFYNDARHCALDWTANQLPYKADRGVGFRVCRPGAE